VSTEDAQDPEASRSWQKRRALDLIAPHGGVLVADYFDRSLPWKRRPEAARLLADVSSPDRPFDAVVIGDGAERDELKAQLERTERPHVMTATEIENLIKELGGFCAILDAATPAERAEVYVSLGLRLEYDPHLHQVTATADLSRVAGCVRGGT
jgi:hypothetical protein